jgi:hypothetical protein
VKLKALTGMLRRAVVRPVVIVESFMIQRRGKEQRIERETDVVEFQVPSFAA